MYPRRELNRLAVYKVWLRRGIALRRTECTVAATRIAQPFAWLDRMLVLWRKVPTLAKVAAVPLVVLAARVVMPRLKILGSLLRWGPLAYGVVRKFGGGGSSGRP